jgi:hypothetical protein
MAMPYFTKRPVTVEAMFWDGVVSTATTIIDWMLASGGTARYHDDPSALSIDTLEGTMTAVPGDWIIKGVRGEFYPCKQEIFEATYVPAAVPGSDEDRIREAMAEAQDHPGRVVTR